MRFSGLFWFVIAFFCASFLDQVLVCSSYSTCIADMSLERGIAHVSTRIIGDLFLFHT